MKPCERPLAPQILAVNPDRVDWSRVSMPYLVSPLSGSGKIEAVLSFVARR
jgi:hypothetical protein